MARVHQVVMWVVFWVSVYPLLFVLSIPSYLAPGLIEFLWRTRSVRDGMTIREVRETVGNRWWSHISLIITCNPPIMRIDHDVPVGSDNGPPTVWMELEGITGDEVALLAKQWPGVHREWGNYAPASAFGHSLDAVRIRRVQWAWMI